MGKNCNSVKHTCSGQKHFATCTEFEGEVNTQSELEQNSCYSIEETTQDQYNQLEDIHTQIDLSELGETCLTYTLDEGKVIVKNALLKYEEEICALKTRVTELETTDICTRPISGCNFNFGDLVDACGNQPQTLGEVIQILLNDANTP